MAMLNNQRVLLYIYTGTQSALQGDHRFPSKMICGSHRVF